MIKLKPLKTQPTTDKEVIHEFTTKDTEEEVAHETASKFAHALTSEKNVSDSICYVETLFIFSP